MFSLGLLPRQNHRGRLMLARSIALAVAALGGTTVSAAEGAAHTGPSELIFLGQIVTLLFVGRLLGELMQRFGQPAVMGQLLAGILLGPTFFGFLWPEGQRALFPPEGNQKVMLNAISQLGILLLLLITGMETDLGLVRKVRRAALSVSIAGIALPFACGFALGEFLPESMLPKPDLRLITSLFLGTALSISSVKIVAMVVREMDFLRRNVGQIIVASAIIDDTIGWVIIAVTFSLALHGTIDLWAIGQTVLGAAVFLALSFTLGRRMVFLLIRWANDELRSEAAVITTILIVMGLMALATQAIGVHTVLGAFVAGILVGQSPILTRQIDEQLRGLIAGLFAPVFFGLAGLSADLTILRDPSLLALTIGLITIASVGKFVGAFVGGAIGGLRSAESLALASGMNARGSTEVIVATIGLSIGALSQDLFTMIVAMAVLTTLAMPPTLRWALARLPLDAAERDRLKREESEARGFVSRMERLMVVADPTAKGRFAARLAGLIAGSRGMPVTVIPFEPDIRSNLAEPATASQLGDAVRTAAEGAQELNKETDDAAPNPIEVTASSLVEEPTEIIASAAGKGFDFLVVGVEPTGSSEGGLSSAVAMVLDKFDGPVAIVAARGAHVSDPETAPISMLLPVNGTDVSRRGAEVALTIARAANVPVTALFVRNAAETTRRRRLTSFRLNEETILREIAQLAEGLGATVRTAARVGIAAEDAIMRQARLGRHDMIVMGVARRPGQAIAFGLVAETVLDASDRSVVFVAS
ncbi:MAG TPA: cation:proton antiporter [Chthoniobacterales bacterium]